MKDLPGSLPIEDNIFDFAVQWSTVKMVGRLNNSETRLYFLDGTHIDVKRPFEEAHAIITLLNKKATA